MKWLCKIAAFQIFSRVPGGARFYHGIQNRFTRSNIPTPGRVKPKMDVAVRYWDCLQKCAPAGWAEHQPHLDFGCGWLPSIPLTLYALGCERQYLADLHPHMTAEHVRATIETFRAIHGDLGRPNLRLPATPAATATRDEMLAALGMTYRAPADPLLQTLTGQLGAVTATDMLLHLSRDVTRAVFREFFRILAPGGFFLAQSRMLQLFGDLQNQMPLRLIYTLSDGVWENFLNSRLMTYNRLKGPDYRALLEDVGFEIREFDVTPGPPEHVELLRRIRPHRTFAHLTPEDLASDHVFFVARKPA